MIFKTVHDLKFRLDTDNNVAVLIENNTNLDSFMIPNRVDDCIVREIESDVFKNNNLIKEIWLPDTICNINFCAFQNAQKLRKVHFYKTSCTLLPLCIDRLAFANCESLEEVTFETKKIVSCGNSAFINCVALKQINEELLALDPHAFENCNNLTDVKFSNGARWRFTTFKGCNNVKKIVFLGNLGLIMTEPLVKWLRNKRIVCYATSALTELAYVGVNIELF